jgi:PAS domain S-box-containing protein
MAEAPLALLLEYLDANPQPTFVARLPHGASKIRGIENGLQFTHANPALSKLKSLHARVIGQLQQNPDASSLMRPGNNPRTDQHTPTVLFCGACWVVTVTGNQWLVAVAIGGYDSPSASRHTGSTQSLTPKDLDCQRLISETRSSVTVSSSSAQGPDQRPLLGVVKPHGHLGDLHFLEWMQQFDWESSPVGPISGWPAELRTICEFALATSEPINILWGDQCTFLYNQAYSLVVGDKHPRAMGRPFKENFEQWPHYHRILSRMKETGRSITQEKLQRMLVRDGFLEEDFFDLLMVPILAADGSVAGFTTRVHEVTRQVIFERRMKILVDTNKAIATMYNMQNLCTAAAGVLAKYTSDIHFAAIYSVHSSANTLSLALECTAGMSKESTGSQHTVASGTSHFGLEHSILETCRTQKATVLSISNHTLNQATLDQLQDYGVRPCREVVIHPMKCFIEDNTAAIMIVGTSPLRKFDEDYRSFLRLLTRQIENGITVTRGLVREREVHKAQVASEMEGRFLRFAESAPVGMYMFNSEDVLTYWNTAFEDICGTAGPALSEPMAWLKTIHPDKISDMTAILESYSQSERDEAISFEVQFTKPWTSKSDGAEVMLDRTYALGVIQPEYSDDGKLKGTLGCITDISSLKWAEKMQSAQLSEAIEQRRQQENFLDVTSHEMSAYPSSPSSTNH